MKNAPYGIRELANWVLRYAQERDVKLSNMSVNKLVYFAYEYSLVFHNKKLSNAKIEAWDHGPVFRELYQSFKKYGNGNIEDFATKYNPLTDSLEYAVADINPEDESILRSALNPILHLPAYILREISHASDSPWATTWHHKTESNPGMQITDDLIIEIGRKKGKSQ